MTRTRKLIAAGKLERVERGKVPRDALAIYVSACSRARALGITRRVEALRVAWDARDWGLVRTLGVGLEWDA